MGPQLTTENCSKAASECPVSSHLRTVIRTLSKTGIQGVVLVVGCSSGCSFRSLQTLGISLIPEREFNGSRSQLGGIWVASASECKSDLLSLVELVRPGGAIIITSDASAENLCLRSHAALPGVQVVMRNTGVLVGLRRVDVDQRCMEQLVRRWSTKGWRSVLKRAVDFTVGCLGLLLALPWMAIIAILIKITSPGPAIMRQVRVKQGGELFTFYKFRTMPIDARLRFPNMYSYEYGEDELASKPFKSRDDPRNTKFGRLIRRLSIDELPNLINCIRGDVSLVGPRPDLPEMISYYAPNDLVVLAAKPGITGAAQVGGRDDLSVRSQLEIDRQYVERWSLWSDTCIVARTIWCIVSCDRSF